MTEQQQATITRNTRLTVGVAITIFGGIVFQLNQQANTNLAIREVQRDILEMRKSLADQQADQWNGRDMAAWRDLLESMNKEVRVPKIRRNS